MTAAFARAATDGSVGLSIRQVTHGYRIDGVAVPVVDALSLEVAPGEVVALVGTSGCGKSTLLRLVAGLETPDAGVIEAGGDRVQGVDPTRLLVFQDPTLFPWRTVRANVAFAAEVAGRQAQARNEIDRVIDLVGLSAFAGAYPHQLSGGMAQRAALARAIVNHPKVLLLDEPFGRLDALTRLDLQEELLRLRSRIGFTGILVTHDVEEALLLADRVVVLSPRPARILTVVAVDLKQPRDRSDPALVRLRQQILGQLHAGRQGGASERVPERAEP